MWSRSRNFRNIPVLFKTIGFRQRHIPGHHPKEGNLWGCPRPFILSQITYNNGAGHRMRILWVYHAAMNSSGQDPSV